MDADAALLQECTKIAVSTWSDAMDEFGIDGVMSGLTRRSGEGRFAALAVTARFVAQPPGRFSKDDFGIDRLIEATGPGKALMLDLGGREISSLGGIAALRFSQRNASAVIIDGGCRDVDEIISTGLWVMSRHVTPRTGLRRLKLISMGMPIKVGNVDVTEGDIVIGDGTGVVVVPKADFAQIQLIAERLEKADAQFTSSLRSGKSFRDSLNEKSATS